MKEKLYSFFPYLLLVLFFVTVLAINSKTQMSEPIVAYNFNEKIPEIPASNNAVSAETEKDSPQKDEPEKEPTADTEIIEENSSDNICFYTRSGKKYHFTEDCRYLKNSSKIIKTTVDFAIELGLEPCSGCIN